MADQPSRRYRRTASRALTVLALGVSSLIGIGCGGTTPPAGGPAASAVEDSTPVILDGSSTVGPISQAAQEDYSRINPKVDVVLSVSGTSGGFSKYLKNEVDIVNASRPATDAETTAAKAAGMDWVRFIVGYDGITVVVSAKNTFAKDLSVAQLKKLWEAESQARTWKDLDPSWPDREINLYGPDTKSGTFEFFTQAINGKAKSQRKGVQQNSDDNTLVNGVAGDPDGLGYFGYAYYAANAETLHALAIKNGDDAPVVRPSPETILDKTYAPLSRPLFIYVKKSTLTRPGVAAFVTYYLDHVAEVAPKAKYVAPTAEDIKANKEALDAILGPKKGPTA